MPAVTHSTPSRRDVAEDDNPRPLKKQRIQPQIISSPLSSPLSSLPPSSQHHSPAALRPLPPTELLLALPALLAHPPTHRNYVHSIALSLAALRRCLTLPALPPEVECRAWTGIAELGMRGVALGMGGEAEVEKALSRGSIIAQKHPSLRAYMHQLALLQAQFSQWQHKAKFARTQIRGLLSSFAPSDPPHIIYTAHLALIAFLTTPADARRTDNPTGVSPGPTAQDVHAALAAIQDFDDRAVAYGHKGIALLARVLRARTLVAANMWAEVPEAVRRAEGALGLKYEPAATPKGGPQTTFVMFEDAFEAAMVVHTLMLSVVCFTHVGDAAEVSPRLSHLHALLDADVLDKFPEGFVEVPFPSGPPLVLQITHPRILFLLTFLVSSVAKRDAVGRKPKRKVFATEGLVSWEAEALREVSFSTWATAGDMEEVEQRLARIKADLLCEVIAISTMRSEFDTAEENLDMLIAHTRTYDIFPLFAARIALHHAHLAHALGLHDRALQCYRAAAHHAESGSFVYVAARAGDIALRVALQRKGAAEQPVSDQEGMEVVRLSRGMGGTLEAVGRVLEACFTPEILKSKQQLKHALERATRAQDNHLRALVLALISAHYMHTAGEHAHAMLQTCEQLAAGLGAPPTKPDASQAQSQVRAQTGNAPLGLWVGERMLELYRRAGKGARVQKQGATNARLRAAVEEVERRSARLGVGSAR